MNPSEIPQPNNPPRADDVPLLNQQIPRSMPEQPGRQDLSTPQSTSNLSVPQQVPGSVTARTEVQNVQTAVSGASTPQIAPNYMTPQSLQPAQSDTQSSPQQQATQTKMNKKHFVLIGIAGFVALIIIASGFYLFSQKKSDFSGNYTTLATYSLKLPDSASEVSIDAPAGMQVIKDIGTEFELQQPATDTQIQKSKDNWESRIRVTYVEASSNNQTITDALNNQGQGFIARERVVTTSQDAIKKKLEDEGGKEVTVVIREDLANYEQGTLVFDYTYVESSSDTQIQGRRLTKFVQNGTFNFDCRAVEGVWSKYQPEWDKVTTSFVIE